MHVSDHGVLQKEQAFTYAAQIHQYHEGAHVKETGALNTINEEGRVL